MIALTFGVLLQIASRLPPSAFPGLPYAVRQELVERRCLTPRLAPLRRRHNVVRGSFERPGQIDWAVLCSTRGVSRILVFWNGDPARVTELARGPDHGLRILGVVGRDFIVSHHRANGGPPLPPTRHQGIEDIVMEKASVVYYRYRGRWLVLAGTD
ncbi:MAG: hypothetical protein R2729_31745 [Bryobacteraceae bacterium]